MVKSWDNQSGLLGNSITALAQSNDGYIWVGTQLGLARFDGVRFESFHPRTHPSLKDAYVLALAAGHDGSLWLQTPQGIQRWRNDKFEPPIFPGDRVRNGLHGRMFESQDGAIWVLLAHGVLRWKNGTVRTWGNAEGLASVTGIAEDRRGRIWISTADTLQRLEDEHFKRQEIAVPRGQITDLAFTKNEMVLAINGVGLALLDRDVGAVLKVIRKPAGKELGRWLYVDHRSVIWAYWRTGIVRINGGQVEQFEDREHSLPAVVFEDREDSLWLGGFTNGLQQLSNTIVKTVGWAEGLPSNTTWSLFEDKEGALWISSRTGLSRYWKGKVETQTELTDTRIVSMADAPTGLLAATSKGLFRLKKGKAEFLESQEKINSILPQRDGVYLLAGTTLRLWDDRRKTSIQLSPSSGGTHFWFVKKARDGISDWVPRKGAIARLSNKVLTDAFSGPIGGDAVTGLVEDKDGVLWASDVSGVLWRGETGKLTRVPLNPRLNVVGFVSMVDDDMGRLWLGSAKGIFVFSKQALTEAARSGAPADGQVISTHNGMRNVECNTAFNEHSAIRTKDGMLWFATEGGAASFNPRLYQPNAYLPVSKIEALSFRGKALTSGQMQPGAPLEVGPGEGNFEVRYTGVTMASPDLVRFRYKLDGFDKDFVEAGSRRVAFYTNLPPGKYRFVLEARNSDGLEGQPAALEFVLLPHVYETSWFRASCVLALLLSVAGVYRWRTRTIEMANLELIRHAQMLRCTADIGQNLLRSDEPLTYMEKAFAQVGEAAGLSRVYFVSYQDRGSESYYSVAQSWCAAGVQSHVEAGLVEFPVTQVPEWNDMIQSGKSFWTLAADAPPSTRPFLTALKTLSTGCVPVLVEQRWIGAVVYDDCSKPRIFREAEIDVLATVAHSIAAALNRQAMTARFLADRNRETQARVEELCLANEALGRSFRDLSWPGNLPRYPLEALRQAIFGCGADSGCIFLHEEASDTVAAVAMILNGEEKDVQGDPIVQSFSIAARVLEVQVWNAMALGKILWIDGQNPNQEDWAMQRDLMLRTGHRFLAYIPMLQGAVAIGFLTMAFESAKMIVPTESRFALFRIMAQQATLAVQLTRLASEANRVAVLEERNRIARDIHDTLAQNFTGIFMQLRAAREFVETDPGVSLTCMNRAESLARDGLREARQSVMSLVPGNSPGADVAQEIRTMLEQATADKSHTRLSIQGDARPVGPQLSSNLVLVCREALGNAQRYANASQIDVTLNFAVDSVELQIRDNGDGFVAREVANSGFGLAGMKDRAARIGGELTINSTLGEGTTIRLHVPIDQTREASS